MITFEQYVKRVYDTAYWRAVCERKAVQMSNITREQLESEGFTVLEIEPAGEFTNINVARIDTFTKAVFKDRAGNEYTVYADSTGTRYNEETFLPNWMPTTV